MSYKNLEIWQIANELVNEIHTLTLTELPSVELYETGRQIRRSVKSVKSNIVEGFGRRRYQKEYLHFLTIAMASNIETIDHLDTLFETRSFTDAVKYHYLKENLDILGRKINKLIRVIRRDLEK
jgi:four helix bundle protein